MEAVGFWQLLHLQAARPTPGSLELAQCLTSQHGLRANWEVSVQLQHLEPPGVKRRKETTDSEAKKIYQGGHLGGPKSQVVEILPT